MSSFVDVVVDESGERADEVGGEPDRVTVFVVLDWGFSLVVRSAMMEEIRAAVVTLAKSHDEQERRLAALEAQNSAQQMDALLRNAQLAAKGVVELKAEHEALRERLDLQEKTIEGLTHEMGQKAHNAHLTALLSLKADRQQMRECVDNVGAAREEMLVRVSELHTEIEQLARRLASHVSAAAIAPSPSQGVHGVAPPPTSPALAISIPAGGTGGQHGGQHGGQGRSAGGISGGARSRPVSMMASMPLPQRTRPCA